MRKICSDNRGHLNRDHLNVRRHISKPWTTIKRELEALHMLGLVHCEENIITTNFQDKTTWHYSLAANVDRRTLLAMAGQKNSSIFSPSPEK